MRFVLPGVISLLVSLSGFTQSSLYTISLLSADGQSHAIGEWQGHKIWVVVLPATQTSPDSAFLSRVDSITRANQSKLTTICVPSYEDGYAADSSELLNWYRASLDSLVLISMPFYTHKISAGHQAPLFQWLTNVSQNTHFDDDISGACQSFFIDESGTLYAVFDPDARFSNKAINRVLP
jgi:glutathione peroxidase-family protein